MSFSKRPPRTAVSSSCSSTAPCRTTVLRRQRSPERHRPTEPWTAPPRGTSGADPSAHASLLPPLPPNGARYERKRTHPVARRPRAGHHSNHTHACQPRDHDPTEPRLASTLRRKRAEFPLGGLTPVATWFVARERTRKSAHPPSSGPKTTAGHTALTFKPPIARLNQPKQPSSLLQRSAQAWSAPPRRGGGALRHAVYVLVGAVGLCRPLMPDELRQQLELVDADVRASAQRTVATGPELINPSVARTRPRRRSRSRRSRRSA